MGVTLIVQTMFIFLRGVVGDVLKDLTNPVVETLLDTIVALAADAAEVAVEEGHLGLSHEFRMAYELKALRAARELGLVETH